jgi:hypothetical protein
VLVNAVLENLPCMGLSLRIEFFGRIGRRNPDEDAVNRLVFVLYKSVLV